MVLVTGAELLKLPPAPLSVKFTVRPEMPFPYWSVTDTMRVFGNLFLGFADWLFP